MTAGIACADGCAGDRQATRVLADAVRGGGLFGVAWSAGDDANITARFDVDGRSMEMRYLLDDAGRIRSFVFDRWHDPDGSGQWATYPCGGEVTDYRTFNGLTIPSAGRLGWFYGTDRWPQGEFFRYEITDLDPIR